MLLDHKTAFSDYHAVDFLFDMSGLQVQKAEEKSLATPQLSNSSTQRPQAGGVLPATLLETETGFKQARALRPGDMIQTLDGGLREVQNIRHCVPRLTAMIHVPAGALGNDADLELPSDTMVALDLDTAETLFDTPVVTAKLVALVGYNGISTALPQRIARVHVELAEEELIWAEGGMLINTATAKADAFYPLLSLAETRKLMAFDADRAVTDVTEVEADAAGLLEQEERTGMDFTWSADWLAESALDLLFGRKAA